MKRRIIIVAILLLAGAVVNVAVAWGIVLRGEPCPSRAVLLHEADAADAWKRLKSASWPAGPQMLAAQRIEHFGGTTLEAYHPRDGETPWIDVTAAWEWRVGVPRRSLRFVVRRTQRQVNYAGAWRCAVALPLLPVWPGFAVNTAFYAVVLWLLIPGPFVLRRFIRARHSSGRQPS